MLVQAAFKTFGQNVVTCRSSNNFGTHQFPEKVIPLFVTNLIEGKVRKAPQATCMQQWMTRTVNWCACSGRVCLRFVGGTGN